MALHAIPARIQLLRETLVVLQILRYGTHEFNRKLYQFELNSSGSL
jgi:hypothetical protein